MTMNDNDIRHRQPIPPQAGAGASASGHPAPSQGGPAPANGREPQQQQAQPDEEAPGVEPDRIDVDDKAAVAQWAKRLDVSPEQISEAIDAVGDLATDVEMHLKGTRSTTNADRLDELEGDDDL